MIQGPQGIPGTPGTSIKSMIIPAGQSLTGGYPGPYNLFTYTNAQTFSYPFTLGTVLNCVVNIGGNMYVQAGQDSTPYNQCIFYWYGNSNLGQLTFLFPITNILGVTVTNTNIVSGSSSITAFPITVYYF